MTRKKWKQSFCEFLLNMCDDTYAVEVKLKEVETVTKRLMLKTLARTYDPLGII